MVFVVGRPSQLGPDGLVRCTVELQLAVSGLSRQGFSLLGPEDYTAPSGQIFTTWLDEERDLKIDLQEHPRFDVLFLEVGAGTVDDLEQVRNALSARLPMISSESLRNAAVNEMEVDPATLYRLAIGSPLSYDQGIADVFRRALVHPVADVREFAAYGATLTNWTELADSLRQQLATEPEPRVRAMLEQGLRAMASFATPQS